jgi:D-3-phosphoglycerate dehydrogenase / 2-oxoglutarate reductase
VKLLLSIKRSARVHYYSDKALTGLHALGEVRLNDSDEALVGDALIDAAQGCQVIVSDRQTAAPAALFAACPQLVVFLRCAVDIRNIDLAAASAHGVLVTRASAGFGNAVAEWVLGVMLDGARGISRSVLAYRSGAAPVITMGRELRGSRLGIIGYGHIGRHLADMALALGMDVAISDPSSRPDDARIDTLPLDALLERSDCVVCLAPALPETENLMNAAAFARMPRGAFFVNASRGNLLDEAALRDALDRGHLAGCALDVGRAPDQMPTPELATHPKVIATPHIGGLTPAAAEHQALETVAQLAVLLQGEMPSGAVNPAQATRLADWRTSKGQT